jgi:hypothetical protein
MSVLSNDIPFPEKRKFFDSKEYKKKEKEYIEKEVAKALENIKNKSHIYYTSFSDNDGVMYSHLEHEVMPDIKGLIYLFDEH